MNDSLLSGLFPENIKSDTPAVKYCSNYPALNRSEAWRWTPLDVLRKLERKLEIANYQTDAPECVDEDFDTDAFANALLEDTDAPFAVAGLALVDNTLCFTVPANTNIEEPIAINIDALGKKWQFSRVAIHLEAGAKASFWLDIASERNAVQFSTLLINVAENAHLEGVIWQSAKDTSDTAQLIYVHSEQAANSDVRINAVQSGAALSRLDLVGLLKEDNARFDFGGIEMLKDDHFGDFHINIRHLAEFGTSHQIIRGALADESHGLFDGKIYVAHDAQKTDGKQNSRFILLSDKAKAQGIPRLEIYADDVQCAHGTTVGFLDPDMIFYLRSRGLSEGGAKSILLLSFLEEAVIVSDKALHQSLADAIKDTWEECHA